MRVFSETPASVEYVAWTSAYSRQAVADQAQAHCQRSGRNAQIVLSELTERDMLRGNRVFYRFNCVR